VVGKEANSSGPNMAKEYPAWQLASTGEVIECISNKRWANIAIHSNVALYTHDTEIE
jgi:hypothetical protein